MTQKTITIRSYPLLESAPGLLSISLDVGAGNLSRTVLIASVTDCERALELFAAEMTATGKPWHLSVSFDKRSGRKPAGFDAAGDAGRLRRNVNEHLLND